MQHVSQADAGMQLAVIHAQRHDPMCYLLVALGQATYILAICWLPAQAQARSIWIFGAHHSLNSPDQRSWYCEWCIYCILPEAETTVLHPDDGVGATRCGIYTHRLPFQVRTLLCQARILQPVQTPE